MKCAGRLTVILAVAGLGSSAKAITPATQPADSNLQAKVDRLEAELQEMKQREAARDKAVASVPLYQPATVTYSNSDVAKTEGAVESDAASHSKLLDMQGMGAGYQPGKGFIIKSDDGNYLLHPWAYAQFRNVTNYREGVDGKDVTQNGFEVARLKFIMDGNVFTPDLTYQFIWSTARATGNLQLNDGWARYRLHDTPFAFEVGQIRNPFDHEQILFATQSMTTERSFVDDVFANGEGFVKGIELSYGYDTPGTVRAEAAFSSGMRNYDQTFQQFPTNSANYGGVARVEYKVFGNWKDYDHFSALNDKHPLLVLGGAVDYTETGSTGQLSHVGDVQFDLPSGLSLYAAYLGRYVKGNQALPNTNGGATTAVSFGDTYDTTARLMAAYCINNRFEPFVRYQYVQFDRAELPAAATKASFHEFTLGGNYYFYGQRAKVTAEASYLPNGSPIDDTGSETLSNTSGANQIIVTAQFQLII